MAMKSQCNPRSIGSALSAGRLVGWCCRSVERSAGAVGRSSGRLVLSVGRAVGRSSGRSSGRLVLSVGRAVDRSSGRLVGWSAVGWSAGAVGRSSGRLVSAGRRSAGRLAVALLTVGGGVESVGCVKHAALWRADDARIVG